MQDIRRQLIIGLRWLPLIVVCAVVAGGIAYAYSSSQPKVYEATGTLLVDVGPVPSTSDLTVAERATERYAFDMASPDIARAVINRLGLDETPQSLSRQISVNAEPETVTIGYVVRNGDPEQAQRIAQAFGDETIALVDDRLINRDDVDRAQKSIRRTENLIRILNNRRQGLQDQPNKTPAQWAELQDVIAQIAALEDLRLQTESESRGNVRNLLGWVAQPRLPDTPVEPQPLYWTLLALVVGGMGGAALAFLLEYLLFGRKVRDERDLEEAIGLPVLGSATEKRGDIRRGDLDRLVMLRYPRSPAAEAYKSLVAKIGYADGSVRTLLVASTGDAATRSAVAANIALAYAEASRNVILVDADYRSPRLHEFFDVPNDRGLTNLLIDQNVPLGWVTVPTAHPRLGLLPGGPRAETAGSFSAPVVNVLIRRLMHAADVVVFAGPPITALDSAVLASHLDGSVLVVPAGTTTDEAVEAAAALEGAESRLTGAVLYRRVRGAHPRGSAVKLVAPRAGFRPKPEPDTSPKQIPAVIPIEVPADRSFEQVAATARPPVVQQAPAAMPGPAPNPETTTSRPPHPQGSPGQAPFPPPNGNPQARPGTPPPPAGRPQGQPWGPAPAPAASPAASNGRGTIERTKVPPPPYSAPFDPQGVATKK